jgi:type II secretory pathway component PulC
MSRSFVLGLSALTAGLLATNVTLADHSAIPQSTAIVRAQGHAGSVEALHSAHALATELQAGSITRSELRAELANGIGRFLQNVRVQAVLSHGEFLGWRLLALFPKRPDVHVQVLKAGDVLLRINGESIERPESFKAVFDSLTNAKELVLDIERDGQASTLRYSIVDA